MNRKQTDIRPLGRVVLVSSLLVIGYAVSGCADWPSSRKDEDRPRDVIGVMQSLKTELGKLSATYPELAGAKDIKIISAPDASSHTVAYSNNCTFLGKRGYQDTGANALAIGLRVITAERFRRDVREVAMQAPEHSWRNLNLVGWSNLHLGKDPSPGLTDEINKLLAAHVKMIDDLDGAKQ